MISLAVSQLADATGGHTTLPADRRITGPVVTDNRQVVPGAVFVALPGERVDGHDFAAAAVEAGAALVVATRPLPDELPVLYVDDGLRALAGLARAWLAELRRPVPGHRPPTVLAVTGSQGKTTTKDLLAHLLAGAGATVAPVGSHNNELGVPLTVLEADASTRFLVLEMGARGIGHIRYLTDIARPDVGVVLCVGTSHLGEFGSVENIARAKGEMVEALAGSGRAVLNHDDRRVRDMAGRTDAPVTWFGQGELPGSGGVRATDVDLDAAGRLTLTLGLPGSAPAPVTVDLLGEHHAMNVAAAAAAALAAGLTPDQVLAGLASAHPASPHRMELHHCARGIDVVNDAYNANPESTAAALKWLAAAGRGRRTWAVLGEMLELGETSIEGHDAMGRLAVRLDIGRTLAVGAGARAVYQGAVLEGSWGEEAAWAPDVDAALRTLRDHLLPGDLVLVKSSHGSGLAALGDRLVAELGPAGHGPAEPRQPGATA